MRAYHTLESDGSAGVHALYSLPRAGKKETHRVKPTALPAALRREAMQCVQWLKPPHDETAKFVTARGFWASMPNRWVLISPSSPGHGTCSHTSGAVTLQSSSGDAWHFHQGHTVKHSVTKGFMSNLPVPLLRCNAIRRPEMIICQRPYEAQRPKVVPLKPK